MKSIFDDPSAQKVLELIGRGDVIVRPGPNIIEVTPVDGASGVSIIEVIHHRRCPFLNDLGPCNCDPLIIVPPRVADE